MPNTMVILTPSAAYISFDPGALELHIVLVFPKAFIEKNVCTVLTMLAEYSLCVWVDMTKPGNYNTSTR